MTLYEKIGGSVYFCLFHQGIRRYKEPFQHHKSCNSKKENVVMAKKILAIFLALIMMMSATNFI